MTSQLTPKPIVDKNGKATTVHVKSDSSTAENTRSLPVVPTKVVAKQTVADAKANLDAKLDEVLGEHKLTVETVEISAEKNQPTRYPAFKAVDVNFTVVRNNEEGVPTEYGASLIFRATDIHYITKYGYAGRGSWGMPSEVKEELDSAIDIARPELKAYHDAVFEKFNRREPEPVNYVTKPKEARAFLLDLAGYEPWHDQNNGRLVGMAYKIAGIERMAHKMPEIFAAVEVLEAAGKLQIPDFVENSYADAREQYHRLRAAGL